MSRRRTKIDEVFYVVVKDGEHICGDLCELATFAEHHLHIANEFRDELRHDFPMHTYRTLKVRFEILEEAT